LARGSKATRSPRIRSRSRHCQRTFPRAKARKEHEAPGKTLVDPASPEGQKLMAEYADALKESIKLPLKTITREDLRIDANRLSASDVAALRFIIEKAAN
jgi:hypothetical protein